MRHIYVIVFCVNLLISGTAMPAGAGSEQFADNVVDITITSQGYDYNAPWQKLSVQKETISGVVIDGNRILTISYKLANHVLVEVSKFGINRKYPAKVLLKDYQCGLALITVEDITFFENLKPVEFNSGGTIKDARGLILKWDANGIMKKHSIDYLKSSIEFFESGGAVLIHQMISDIESAGQGEPVFINGKFAGLSSWHIQKTKTVKVIDLDVVERMLKDEAYGYKGLPFIDVEDAALENDENLKEYLGLRSENSGVLITAVPTKTSGADVLKKGDVILTIDGNKIDDNGLYESKKYGKLNYFGLICLNHFVDDTVRMQIFRDKKKVDISFKLQQFSNDNFLIRPIAYDAAPNYLIIGGFLFQEFTKEYLKTWGKDWMQESDKRLMFYYENLSLYPTKEKKNPVLLTNVLPASVNIGYHNIKNVILQKVNGKVISDINDLKLTVDGSKEKYLVFDFLGGQTIVLDAVKAKNSLNEILKKYKIASSYHLDNK